MNESSVESFARRKTAFCICEHEKPKISFYSLASAQADKLLCYLLPRKYEPCCEKTGLWGSRPGLTQTGLYSHRRWIEA